MPTLIEETRIELEFSDLARRRPVAHRPAPRSPGVHVSGVLRFIAEKHDLLDPSDLDEIMPMRMANGTAIEEYFASFEFLSDMDYQPGEVERDGVFMTCDGITACRHGNVVDEFKCTWKSYVPGLDYVDTKTGITRPGFVNELNKKTWYWLQQGKCYCAGYGPRIVRWWIYYVNGDYRGSGPMLVRYLVEFTDKEIERAWAMVVKYRDEAKPEAA